MARRTAGWCVWALALLATLAAVPALAAQPPNHPATQPPAGSVAVDPPDRLANATVLQPWPAAGEVRDLPNGPDLDFGYNDFLQIRLTAPAGAGDVRISYGTSTHPGFDPTRVLILPAGRLLRDGKPHTYRLDLGLEVWWRDTLKDLRVEMAGRARPAVEYVEVGDLPGDVYLVNTDLNIYVGEPGMPAEKMSDTKRMESKHFCFWWSPHSYVVDKGFDPVVMGRRALRMCEECYQVYCRKHGYPEPFENADPKRRDGHRYKVNMTSWYQGTWMGAQNGWSYGNVPGWGLRDEGWGNPLPHEFAHALQGFQPSFLTGAHWESHANYLRELRNRHFKATLGPDYKTSLERSALDVSCYQQDAFRLIYADFRIHTFLDDLAGELGLPANMDTRLWSEGPKEMVAWQKLAYLLPAGKSVKDVACQGLRHWVLLDLADGASYRAKFRGTPKDAALMDQATGSFLEPCQDRPGWWRVPWARAPMRYAYMFHELQPARPGGTLTVELRGLDLPGTGEDWRWSLVAAGEGRKPRYSGVFKPGRQSFKLQPGETRAYLVVVATPDQVAGSPHGTYNEFPLDRHPNFRRYPYEVRITGATPLPRAAVWPEAGGHRHPNGGGWVADTAQVAPTAYVGPHARVLDTAQVRGRARVEDYAVIRERAVVDEDAVVSGAAWVGATAVVKGHARVRDHAQVYGNSVIDGDARVQGYAKLDGVKAQENALLRGNAQPWGCTLAGHAIADYDYSMAFNLRDGVHFNHIPWGGWFDAYFAQTQHKPRGLMASYRIDEPDGEICWDEFGGLHAIARGGPARVESAGRRALLLNGKEQYLVLDRSVADTRAFTFGTWCRPADAVSGRPLLFLGSSPNRYVELVARDAAGRPALIVKAGAGPAQQLVAKAAVPVGAWTYLAVTLADGQARLYVNGRPAGEGPVAHVVEEMLAPDDYSSPQANYVGRDWQGRTFAGQVADIRCYNVALTDDEVRAEMQRAGHLRGVFCEKETEFDGKATTIESGILNGRERTLAAWIRPRTAGPADEYAAVFDCRDERDGARQGSGFGVAGGKIRVRLDGRGFWDTGDAVALDKWQHVALAFDGSTARLYVDGQEAARTTYTAGDALAAKNYRIGFTQSGEDPKSRVFFDGWVRDARIYDRALDAAEVKALASVPALAADDVKLTTAPDGKVTAEHEGRRFALAYNGDMERFAAADAKDPTKSGIVFTGSSTFVKWRTLTQDMAPLPVVNRAFGGSTSPQLWYYADRAVIARAPKVVVVYEGDNDLIQSSVTVDNYLKYIRLFIARVREKLPETRFLFVSNKPSVARWKAWPKYQEANKQLKALCDADPKLTYVDTTPTLLDDKGEVRQECYTQDPLHFDQPVYQEWTKVIKPVLERVWKEAGGA